MSVEVDYVCFDCVTTGTTEWVNVSEFGNGTESGVPNWSWPTPLFMIITSSVLGLMILTTIIGNIFVIAAVVYERNLQNVANYLVVSLAVADLMVACLVMPLGALYEIMGTQWILGPVLCDMWTSSDVLCCTASILHLVSIALDRFWAVTDIEYIRSRNKTRINTMIGIVWLVAVAVSLAPVLGWKDPQFYVRLEVEKKCLVSQDTAYQVFATCSSFYVPLCVILLLYWKIFQTARRRIRRRPGRIQNEKTPVILPDEGSSRVIPMEETQTASPQPQTSRETTDLSNRSPPDLSNRSPPDLSPEGGRKSETIESLIAASEVGAEEELDNQRNSGVIAVGVATLSVGVANSNDKPKNVHMQMQHSPVGPSPTNSTNLETEHKTIALATLSPTALIAPTLGGTSPGRQLTTIRKRKQESIEAKRERKAAKTLAIITGAFVVCWLPFFVMALTLALCGCEVPDTVSSAFLWLGYFNSTLNPIIYTLFSPEFRQAFKRILCGRNYGRRRR